MSDCCNKTKIVSLHEATENKVCLSCNGHWYLGKFYKKQEWDKLVNEAVPTKDYSLGYENKICRTCAMAKDVTEKTAFCMNDESISYGPGFPDDKCEAHVFKIVEVQKDLFV